MIFKNIKVINYDNTIENCDIEIQNNIITRITPKEGQGETLLVPGFIDTHIHGFTGLDVMNSQADLAEISKQLAYYGTTSFMPTAMTKSWSDILAALNMMGSNENWVARSLGLHIEGPFIGLGKKGAHKEEYLLKGTHKRIERMYLESKNKLRKISFDPLMVPLDVMEYMLKLKIIPSIGHSVATYQNTMEYFNHGCTSVCHLWNAMSGIDSRHPGMLEAALYDKRCYTELICDLFHVSKEGVLFTIANKGVDKIICVSDAITPAYAPDGEYVSGDIPVTKKGPQIYLKGTTTIAGSGITIHDAFKNLHSIGVSLNDAVAMTSYNAAKYLDEDQLGYIKEGAKADLVFLEPKSLEITNVYIDGQQVR